MPLLKIENWQLKILLENGADPNVHYKEDDSALHVAVGHSDIEIVKLLLKHGAKVKDEKKFGDVIYLFMLLIKMR